MTRALESGRTLPRRRALFGALDADGWAWAFVKALIWFIIIIILLAYIPDRAYYFTVNRTIDIGVLAVSPINLCPPENEGLPCPAPAGAALPWHPSPPELSLSEARTDATAIQVGTTLLLIGGSVGDTATADVRQSEFVDAGTYAAWTEGPALPEPRADARAVFLAGSIYVIGGRDTAGAPTNTVYILTPSAETGELGEWVTQTDNQPAIPLPEPRAAAGVIALEDGLLVVGGDGPNGPANTTWKATIDDDGVLGAWEPGPPLARPVSDATAVLNGDYVWVYGGRGPNGVEGSVQRGVFASGGGGEGEGEGPGASPGASDGGGANPSGDAGASPSGDAGASPSGAPGASPSGDAGASPSADAGASPSGAAGASPSGENPGASPSAGEGLGPSPSASEGAALEIASLDGSSGLREAAEIAAVEPSAEPGPVAIEGWQTDLSNSANLPAARANAAGWATNGGLYLVGGTDGQNPQRELWWTVPTGAGDITEWRRLPNSDLPESAGGLEGAAVVVSGPNAYLFGGTTNGGTQVAGAVRSNLAPQEPFFQLGLVGATVPALKIDGEIGQQLGYLNAAGVGTVNFVILLILGWAFSNRERVSEILERRRQRRRRGG
jgi:hypothetical protein